MITVNPTLEQARDIIAGGSDYSLLPICAEMHSDMYTPMEVMRTLKGMSKHCFILESAEDTKTWGRYTFLGFDPKMKLTCQDGMVVITDNAEQKTCEIASPVEKIQQVLDGNKAPKIDGHPPFCGGLVGYFSYDYAKYLEPTLKLNAEDKCFFRDVDLMLFDKIIAFDHYRQRIILVTNISAKNPDALEAEYERGRTELDYLKKLIVNGTRKEPPTALLKSDFTELFSKEKYCKMVQKAKDYIREGDIFQVVLSNRFEAEFEGSLFDTYRILRGINPSPYMFYFSGTDFEIAGASPETLVKLKDGKLYTFPLAGTRPRGKTDAEDEVLERELLADQKELSEHNMLVDLGRNDLGKISKFGSVKVDKYLNILRFSHVMHIGSVVSGDILEGKTGLDAIGAVLPAGTLSGAPKIRAMEIIDELEQNKRGIYGGAVGYLDFTGNMDTCIAIRLVYKKNNKVYIRSGAGIVADSVPENEYAECVNKSMAVKVALEQSQEGIDS
ncbi:MAG: anthranilate synthase component I [Oscillospiraceae bacterium]|nr:anthranilate synthase component I [Oscillospiraceae bacterium]